MALTSCVTPGQLVFSLVKWGIACVLQTVANPYHRTPFSNKEEQTIEMNSLDEPQGNYADEKRANRKKLIDCMIQFI